jgi:hypothetical protein
MDKTHLDYFNYYLVQFQNDLISYFPFVKASLVQNYRQLLEGNDKKNDIYAKYFVAKVNHHLKKISQKDESLFSSDNALLLLEGVDFNPIWKEAHNSNKQSIWKYLQLLTLLGRKVVPNKQEIMTMLNTVGGVINTPDPVEMKQGEGDDAADSSGLENMANIAGLASSFMGNNTGGGMGELFSGLGGIFNDPQSFLSNMGLDMGSMQEAMSGLATEGGGASDDASGDASDDASEASGSNNPMAEFAEQVSQLGIDDNANPMEAMAKIFQSDKLPELMKASTKMMGDMMKGGGGGNLANMMKQVMQQNPQQAEEVARQVGGDKAGNRIKEANRSATTRDRLRAKLAAKKNSEK